MKYSMLSAVAVLAATSISWPEFYWMSRSSPGHVTITNNLNFPVGLRPVRGRHLSLADRFKALRDQEIVINSHQTVSITTTAASEDLKLRDVRNTDNNQVEVSYSTGGRDSYKYAIKPIEVGGFPGAIFVHPERNQCPRQSWYPGQGDSPQVECRNGVALQVFLQDPHQPPPPFEDEEDDEYYHEWYEKKGEYWQ